LRSVEHGGEMDLDNLVTAVQRVLRQDGLRLYTAGVFRSLIRTNRC